MKRLFRGFAVVAAVAVMAACSSSTKSTTATSSTTGSTGSTGSTAAGGHSFKVALVAPSARNDLSFTQSMVDSLTRVQQQRGDKLQIAYSENLFNVPDAATAIRNYASQGYDLVIAHGSQYGSLIQQIAPQFPKVSFAWGTASQTFNDSNVYAYQVNADQGGYVNGILASQLTKSNVIGVVGPIEVGDAKLYIDGFKNGVAAGKSGIKVNVNYIQSFSDVNLAAQAAKTFIASGADVLTGSAQMVAGAVPVAAQSNALWFGTDADETPMSPKAVVASQVYHWDGAINSMLDGIGSGTLGGKSFNLTLANDGLVIQYNPGYNLPADVKAKGDAAISGIKSGSVSTGVSGTSGG